MIRKVNWISMIEFSITWFFKVISFFFSQNSQLLAISFHKMMKSKVLRVNDAGLVYSRAIYGKNWVTNSKNMNLFQISRWLWIWCDIFKIPMALLQQDIFKWFITQTYLIRLNWTNDSFNMAERFYIAWLPADVYTERQKRCVCLLQTQIDSSKNIRWQMAF